MADGSGGLVLAGGELHVPGGCSPGTLDCSYRDKTRYESTGLVSRYTRAGWHSDLPSLLQPRQNHGCAALQRGQRLLLLVAGGSLSVPTPGGGYREHLASTELLLLGDPAWSAASPLPRPVWGGRAVNLAATLYWLGGFEESEEEEEVWTGREVLRWDDTSEEWEEAASLLHKRAAHMVSIVKLDKDMLERCT